MLAMNCASNKQRQSSPSRRIRQERAILPILCVDAHNNLKAKEEWSAEQILTAEKRGSSVRGKEKRRCRAQCSNIEEAEI